jgi:hypothetical protein
MDFAFLRLLGRRSLLEAETAEHRPALGGLERDRGLLAALGTPGPGLRTHPGAPAGALRLALLAALGVVFELFVVEEKLLACGKHDLRAAIDARQYPI